MQLLKERYSISEKKLRSYTDEITIEVPAGVLRNVHFIYKYTVQHGKVLVTSEGEKSEFIYRVVTDLNLDVTQEDSS